MDNGAQVVPNTITTNEALLAALTYAIPVKVARAALGNKSRSELYLAAARGELVLVKDGGKTLVTVASIREYQANWPRAEVKLAKAPPTAVKRRRRVR
jgi:hypothetical protein